MKGPTSDVADVRRVRRQISERFNHDPVKYFAYLKEQRERDEAKAARAKPEPAHSK